MANSIYDIVIIGGGPAGLTAAIYSARANLNTLLFEGSRAGGQLMLTTEIENFPAHEGLLGPDLMKKMRQHAEKFGTKILSDDITNVDFLKRPFTIYAGEKKLLAKAVIIATGASSKMLGIASEKRLLGRGVSTCAVCDAAFYRNKDVVVVGGGDTALEEALVLTKFASKVTVVHRREQLRASKIMQDRTLNNPKITFAWNSEIVEILGQNRVTGIKLKNKVTGKENELHCDGVFIAIGHIPSTELFKGTDSLLELDENGYIVTQGRNTRTSVPGVFAAGDVTDPVYRQAITSAGMGCMAALDAERFLDS